MSNDVIKILCSRDSLSIAEATERVEDFKESLTGMMDDGFSLTEVEDEFMQEFGLEPDYLFKFLQELS